MIRNIIFSLFLVLPVSVAVASTVSLIEQRQQFLLAEKLIQKGEDSLFLNKLETLKDYTLYPYLQYQWLKNNLDQEKKIKIFLRYYKDTRYAGLLKYKWQYYLAKNKKWKEFVKQYVHSSDKKLQCYYYRAMYNTGAKKGALIGAKKLWVLGKSQPDECDLIFKVLKTSVYFTRELLWQRFEAAITKGSVRVAEYVKGLMNKKDRGVATFWLKVHANPSLITNQTLFRQQQAQAGLIFAHGVDRLASKSLAKAIRVWDAGKRDFIINAATVQRIEQRLAMSLAYRRDEMAYSRLSNLTKPDEVTKEWRVRTALRERNWGRVEQSIAALNKETKEKEKWRYWQARAAEQNNRPKMSNFIYAKLSKERSYFGYLAAEKLNKGYQLSDNPVVVPPEAYKRLKNKADFRVVAELIAVDKEKEAKRQWWYVIKKSDKKSILAAAKYAQELDWKQVAIYTLAKAKYWDDVGVRFPLA
ncbi:MAG: lytic murein transglycosylase, partial [Methylococcaceae bacterium]